jgi:hypothetical protein
MLAGAVGLAAKSAGLRGKPGFWQKIAKSPKSPFLSVAQRDDMLLSLLGGTQAPRQLKEFLDSKNIANPLRTLSLSLSDYLQYMTRLRKGFWTLVVEGTSSPGLALRRFTSV